MAIRRLSTASIKTGSKSNKIWDQDTQQGAIVPIASYELNWSEVYGFTNIPQIYQDLMVVISGVNSQAGGSIAIDNFNGTSTANRSFIYVGGNGSTAASGKNSNIDYIALAYTGGSVSNTVPTVAIAHFINYANTTTHKNIIFQASNDLAGTGDTTLGIGKIASTAAISSFNITTQVPGIYWGNGSRVTLYGIKAGA